MEQSDTEFQRLEVTVGWGHKNSKVKFQIRRIKGKKEEGRSKLASYTTKSLLILCI
jgi:hypothetical protein